jgi:MFS family permease
MQAIYNHYKNAFSNLQRYTWLLAFALFINRSGSMVLLFTSLYFTKELNFSLADAGFMMSFYGIGSVVGSYVGGWLTDKFNYYNIMVTSLISSGLILFLIIPATSMWVLIPVLFFYGLSADMFRPANSVAIATYSTKENRTRSVSLMRLAINLGFSVGPAIGGFIALNLGYKWLFVIDACTSFAAAGMLIAYIPKKQTNVIAASEGEIKIKSISAYRNLNCMELVFFKSLQVYRSFLIRWQAFRKIQLVYCLL